MISNGGSAFGCMHVLSICVNLIILWALLFVSSENHNTGYLAEADTNVCVCVCVHAGELPRSGRAC